MKKNFIIILAIIALLFSFTACKDKTDTVENALAFMDVYEKATNVISDRAESFTNIETALNLTNYKNYVVDVTKLITSTNDSVINSSSIDVTAVKGTFTETAFSNIKDNTGNASRKISGLEITYTYPGEDGTPVKYTVTASAEFAYTVNRESGSGYATYKGTEIKEFKGITINGVAYEDLMMKLTYNNSTSSYNQKTEATIGGKEVSTYLIRNIL